MAGFLDKRTRIIDMVLTDHGKELYSKGELEFAYYAFSDDEVDYDPYIANSGSLSEVALSEAITEQIEATLVVEALFGAPNESDPKAKDESNIQKLLFTMPHGQRIIPEMRMTPDIRSSDLSSSQQTVRERSITRNQRGDVIEVLGERDLGYRKFNAQKLQIDLDIDDFFAKSTHNGYLVRVFASGSDGLREIQPKKDLQNVMSYSGDLRVLRDAEIGHNAEQDLKRLEALEKSLNISRKK